VHTSASRGQYHEVGPHTMCTLQLILLPCDTCGIAGEHSSMYCGYLVSSVLPTAGLEVSQAWLGSGLLKLMTLWPLGRQAKGHWLLRRRVVPSIRWATAAYRLSRSQRAQQAPQHKCNPCCDTVSAGKSRAVTTPTSGWNCSLYSHRGIRTPDRRRHTMGRNGAAPGRRLAATALPPPACAARPCTVYLQCSVL
jgi:hypothetical protein